VRGQSSTYGVAATWGDGKGAPVRGCRFGGAPKIGPPTSVPGPEQYRFGAFDSERVHADATRLETTRLRQLRALCQWALQLPHPVVIAIAAYGGAFRSITSRITAETVWKRMTTSRHRDRFSMYWLSSRARSSIDVSPRRP